MQIKVDISKKECDLIHQNSLRILKTMGATVLSEAALEVFKKAGARVDGKKVFIDERLVEKSLQTVPDFFSIYGNDHKKGLIIGKGDLCTFPPYGATYVSRNNETILGNRKDYIDFTKLNEENSHIKMSCPYSLQPFDVLMEHREAYQMAMTLKYSDKPTFSIVSGKEAAKASIEMIKRFRAVDNYLAIGNVNISAPLIMGEATAEVIMVHCEENQPLMIACGSGLSGLTAPPTPGGNFLLANTAILSGIVLAQILRPGLPIIYAFPLFGVDPVKAETLVGGHAAGLFTLAAKGMANYYHIPFRAGGTFTDSKNLDYQSGYESSLNLLSSLLAEVDLLMHAFGMEDSLKTINYNKYILDENMYLDIKNYLKGFEINDVTMMVDEILKVGSSGNYVSTLNLKLIRKLYQTHNFNEGKTYEETLKFTEREILKRLDRYKRPDTSNEQLNILKGYLAHEYFD